MADLATESCWPVWRRAVGRSDIDAAIRGLYARLDAAIAERGPTCWQSGRCCHFDTYGHRLYVTGLEVAWFLGQGDGGQGSGDNGSAPSSDHALPLLTESGTPSADACPYQRDNRCTTHAIRPLGCRVFFCQEGTQDWQHTLYETFLDELRAVHDRFGLPYRYMEWRAGLREAQGDFGEGASSL